MALVQHSDLDHVVAEVARLRGQIDVMQRRRADTATVPVADELAPLFPEGGLRPGSTYAVTSSLSLLLALLAAPSRAGSWTAVLGVPELGAEAAEGFGVALDRLAMVPDPGDRWMSVAAALSEVVPLIAVRPASRPHEAEVARLSARLRDRGSVLIIIGGWASADVSLRVDSVQWNGVGAGHGLLRSREVVVSAEGRRTPRPRRVSVLLPGPQGGLSAPVATPPLIDAASVTSGDELAQRRRARERAEVTA